MYIRSLTSGGVVATVPMLSHTRQALFHSVISSNSRSSLLVSSSSNTSRSAGDLSESTLDVRNIISSPGALMSALFFWLNSSFHSSVFESCGSCLMCRISWKLFSAASDTSAFWHNAADSICSSSSAQARGKSPAEMEIKMIMMLFWPLLCTLFRLNWAKQARGTMRLT